MFGAKGFMCAKWPLVSKEKINLMGYPKNNMTINNSDKSELPSSYTGSDKYNSGYKYRKNTRF